MNNGLIRGTGWLSRAVARCFGNSGLLSGQATDLMRPVNPNETASGLSDSSSLPHDTVCVQDISGSMKCTDCKPSRLEASKKAAKVFICHRATRSPGDRVGIVTFNNHGRVVLPLTEIGQMDTILSYLSGLRVGGGTNIAEGLKAANGVFAHDMDRHPTPARNKRILLLTDGHGGQPLSWAAHLKGAGVLLEVIGVGGDTLQVNESLLRQVATTDADGFVHYWFFRDTDGLVAHYESLASGLIYRGPTR